MEFLLLPTIITNTGHGGGCMYLCVVLYMHLGKEDENVDLISSFKINVTGNSLVIQ